MKKNKVILFLVILSMLTFIIVGCKSEPEPAPVENPVQEVPPVEPVSEPEIEPILEPEPIPEPEPVSQEPEISEEDLLASATKAAENAKAMKEKIESLSLQEYNEDSYNSGLMAFDSYNTLVAENGQASEKLEKATLAEKDFAEVLDTAFSKLASDKKSEVDQIRKKALEIKADRADKVGYEAAELLYTTANDYSEAKNYENAYNYFVKAKDAFDDVYEDVSAKRQEALEAIERAKNKADNVDEFAAEADKIAPLPSEENNGEE